MLCEKHREELEKFFMDLGWETVIPDALHCHCKIQKKKEQVSIDKETIVKAIDLLDWLWEDSDCHVSGEDYRDYVATMDTLRKAIGDNV